MSASSGKVAIYLELEGVVAAFARMRRQNLEFSSELRHGGETWQLQMSLNLAKVPVALGKAHHDGSVMATEASGCLFGRALT